MHQETKLLYPPKPKKETITSGPTQHESTIHKFQDIPRSAHQIITDYINTSVRKRGTPKKIQKSEKIRNRSGLV
jgi:hypothetical protein